MAAIKKRYSCDRGNWNVTSRREGRLIEERWCPRPRKKDSRCSVRSVWYPLRHSTLKILSIFGCYATKPHSEASACVAIPRPAPGFATQKIALNEARSLRQWIRSRRIWVCSTVVLPIQQPYYTKENREDQLFQVIWSWWSENEQVSLSV